VTINQTGAATGVPGRAREDLALGVAVVLSATGGTTFTWTLVDAPTDETVTLDSAASLSSTTGTTVSLNPDYAGTYCGIVTDGTDTTAWSFYAGPTLAAANDPELFPRRIPSFMEGLAHNVPDSIDPGGNRKGWSREWRRWFRAIVNLKVSAALAGASDNPAIRRIVCPPGCAISSSNPMDLLLFRGDTSGPFPIVDNNPSLVVFSVTNLRPYRYYNIVVGVRVTVWLSALVSGTIDRILSLSCSTDSYGNVASNAVTIDPTINTVLLPTALAATVVNLVGYAYGFGVSVTRPSGVRVVAVVDWTATTTSDMGAAAVSAIPDMKAVDLPALTVEDLESVVK
jgi:hypothetical protein